MADASNSPEDRLARLVHYLESDPQNVSLLGDAANAALSAKKPDLALELLARLGALKPLNETQENLAGVAALQIGDHETARGHFARLLQSHPDDASLRFNHAWALAEARRFEEALSALDDQTAETLPQAAMLQVQLMHELGQFDRAHERARAYAAIFPEHQGLMAAVSVLAVDVEDLDLARACAEKGGDHPDALTTRGMLALDDARDDEARDMFARALAQNSASPRAWLGRGLVAMAKGAHNEAAQDLEHGATLFDSHVGSWIAAGWAHLLSNDHAKARQCFERALEIDRNFGETHGSLAVLALLEGKSEDAQRSADVALRLDPKSMSAILATSMLLEAQGKPDVARRIIERALETPIDASGATIAQAMAKRAMFA